MARLDARQDLLACLERCLQLLEGHPSRPHVRYVAPIADAETGSRPQRQVRRFSGQRRFDSSMPLSRLPPGRSSRHGSRH
jgi:hypothetical protein